jgi:hypothetical protein
VVLDVEISDLTDPEAFNRLGDYPDGVNGLGLLTEAHNVGTVGVDWKSAGTPGQMMDHRHPVIAQSLFRIRSGRLEQIGLAWLKHGFFATNDGCDDEPGDVLGPDCTDIYGSSTNANSAWLGPRSEVNPLTGYWTSCGSHFDTGLTGYPESDPGDCIRTHFILGHGPLDHRLRVSDADILASSNLSRMYCEAFYVVAGDQNIWNNWAHRKCRALWNEISLAWDFNVNDVMVQSPIIMTWGDLQSLAQPDSEGSVVVASRVVDLGEGLWRYEYNVYNMNLDRALDSFTVEFVGVPAAISDLNFHAPVESEEPLYSQAPWTAVVAPAGVTWSAPAPNTMAGEEFPNTLRFGVMHTFWFTADRAPGDASATLTQFKPGAEGPLSAPTRAPLCILGAEDLNGDGAVNTADLGIFLGLFGSAGPAGDINGDNIVDTSDLGLFLNAFGLECP